jgi:hypothetical protein
MSADAIVTSRLARMLRLMVCEQFLGPLGQETGRLNVPLALTLPRAARNLIGVCGSALAVPKPRTSDFGVTARQELLDAHEIAASADLATTAGALQLVPSNLSASPLASTATQELLDEHDTESSPGFPTCPGALQLVPLNVIALPLPSTATQKLLPGAHESETIGV